jgi:hypothetical protein
MSSGESEKVLKLVGGVSIIAGVLTKLFDIIRQIFPTWGTGGLWISTSGTTIFIGVIIYIMIVFISKKSSSTTTTTTSTESSSTNMNNYIEK